MRNPYMKFQNLACTFHKIWHASDFIRIFSKKHNSRNGDNSDKKNKMCVKYFFMRNPFMKFQILACTVLEWTDAQPKTNMPSQLLWSWGYNYCKPIQFHERFIFVIFWGRNYCENKLLQKYDTFIKANETRKGNKKNEPSHHKTNNMACALREDSDQPGHPPSLIRVFAVYSKDSQWPKASSCGQQRLWFNSLESLQGCDSNEYPQHIFLWRNKQNYPFIITKIPSFSDPLVWANRVDPD